MAIENTLSIRSDFSHLQPSPAKSAAVAPNPLDNGETGVDFGRTIWQAVRSIDAQGQAANQLMEDVNSSRSDDLIGAMLASQEASLSFSMLMQVRNKVVGAVEDLIKLQL